MGFPTPCRHDDRHRHAHRPSPHLDRPQGRLARDRGGGGLTVTSAGIVLAATFLVLGVLPLVFLREVGFAVAFGVLLDTFIIRTALVPALPYDIGKWIWWPSRLAKAPEPEARDEEPVPVG